MSEKQKGPDAPLPSKHMAQGPDDFAKATAKAKELQPDDEDGEAGAAENLAKAKKEED